ncbi:hypothetical protein Bca4012_046834 [Brassica carinata]
MILCRLLTYPHLQVTREAKAQKIHWFVFFTGKFIGLRHPTTTMSLFPCEASMAASQDFKPIYMFPLQAFLAHLPIWLIRLPFLSFKSEAVLKNEVKKRNLFIIFSFAFFKSKTIVSCTMKYIKKREKAYHPNPHINTQAHAEKNTG